MVAGKEYTVALSTLQLAPLLVRLNLYNEPNQQWKAVRTQARCSAFVRFLQRFEALRVAIRKFYSIEQRGQHSFLKYFKKKLTEGKFFSLTGNGRRPAREALRVNKKMHLRCIFFSVIFFRLLCFFCCVLYANTSYFFRWQ